MHCSAEIIKEVNVRDTLVPISKYKDQSTIVGDHIYVGAGSQARVAEHGRQSLAIAVGRTRPTNLNRLYNSR